MDALIAKIKAEIDEDVEIVHGEDWHEQEERYWPDRVERQAAAFRRILDRAEEALRAADESTTDARLAYAACSARETIHDLASVYGIEHP